MAYKFQLGTAKLSGSIEQTDGSLIKANTSFEIGAASIDETDLEKIDGITNGTGAANKALVLDGSRDIENINNLMATNLSASSAIIIGDANINEADLEQIDGLTAGTVVASKAVVVDSDKDISAFRNLQAVQLSASSNIVIGSADINETDLEKIDGITNGTVAANKAVVVDASSDISGFRNLSGSNNFQIGGGLNVQGDIDKGSAGTLAIGNDTATAITLGASDCPVTIAGNLFVQGTQTFVTSSTLVVSSSIQFEGLAGNAHQLTLTTANPTSDKTVTIPDLTGHVPLLAGAASAADVTYAEFSQLDGGQNRLDITIVDADGFLMNDGGVMKHVSASAVTSYIGNNITDTVQTKNSDGSISSSAGLIVIAQSASTAYGLRLEPAADSQGKIFKIKRLDGQNVTIECDGSETIDGASSILLESEYAAVMVFSDGSNYFIV